MQDRSSCPDHQPRRTQGTIEEQVVRLRREHRIGPMRLATRCGIAASTAHRILKRHGLPVLAAIGRATGEPVRRFECSRPGELLHIDVKTLGRIPDGGGCKALGRAAGRADQDRRDGTGSPRTTTPLWPTPRTCPTRKPPTCAAFLHRAAA
ncbi:IS481 family transposase IS1652 [Streptomyces sp. enrichment culture]